MSTKSDLLGWINASLGLQLQRLEQLANGAVLCQLLDAYLGNVPMHKVNFFAREDYETITNWKVLQATFTTHNISKELDIGRLSRGAPAESLELMQWLAKHLKRQGVAHGYDAAARRALSVRGGTREVACPSACGEMAGFGRPGDSRGPGGVPGVAEPTVSSTSASSTRARTAYQPTSMGRIDVSHVTSKWKEGLAAPCVSPGSRRRPFASVPLVSGSSASSPTSSHHPSHLTDPAHWDLPSQGAAEGVGTGLLPGPDPDPGLHGLQGAGGVAGGRGRRVTAQGLGGWVPGGVPEQEVDGPWHPDIPQGLRPSQLRSSTWGGEGTGEGEGGGQAEAAFGAGPRGGPVDQTGGSCPAGRRQLLPQQGQQGQQQQGEVEADIAGGWLEASPLKAEEQLVYGLVAGEQVELLDLPDLNPSPHSHTPTQPSSPSNTRMHPAAAAEPPPDSPTQQGRGLDPPSPPHSPSPCTPAAAGASSPPDSHHQGNGQVAAQGVAQEGQEGTTSPAAAPPCPTSTAPGGSPSTPCSSPSTSSPAASAAPPSPHSSPPSPQEASQASPSASPPQPSALNTTGPAAKPLRSSGSRIGKGPGGGAAAASVPTPPGPSVAAAVTQASCPPTTSVVKHSKPTAATALAPGTAPPAASRAAAAGPKGTLAAASSTAGTRLTSRNSAGAQSGQTVQVASSGAASGAKAGARAEGGARAPAKTGAGTGAGAAAKGGTVTGGGTGAKAGTGAGTLAGAGVKAGAAAEGGAGTAHPVAATTAKAAARPATAGTHAQTTSATAGAPLPNRASVGRGPSVAVPSSTASGLARTASLGSKTSLPHSHLKDVGASSSKPANGGSSQTPSAKPNSSVGNGSQSVAASAKRASGPAVKGASASNTTRASTPSVPEQANAAANNANKHAPVSASATVSQRVNAHVALPGAAGLTPATAPGRGGEGDVSHSDQCADEGVTGSSEEDGVLHATGPEAGPCLAGSQQPELPAREAEGKGLKGTLSGGLVSASHQVLTPTTPQPAPLRPGQEVDHVEPGQAAGQQPEGDKRGLQDQGQGSQRVTEQLEGAEQLEGEQGRMQGHGQGHAQWELVQEQQGEGGEQRGQLVHMHQQQQHDALQAQEQQGVGQVGLGPQGGAQVGGEREEQEKRQQGQHGGVEFKAGGSSPGSRACVGVSARPCLADASANTDPTAPEGGRGGQGSQRQASGAVVELLPPDAAELLSSTWGLTGARWLAVSSLQAMGAALDTAEQAVEVVSHACSGLTSLLAAPPPPVLAAVQGLSRGKLSSSQDAVATLLRHTRLLVADVAAHSAQRRASASAPTSPAAAGPRTSQAGAAGEGPEQAAAGQQALQPEEQQRVYARRARSLAALLAEQEAGFAQLTHKLAAWLQQQQQQQEGADGPAQFSNPSQEAAVHQAGQAGPGLQEVLGGEQLGAALRAVGAAQFTLVQGIHREISRLTTLVLQPGGSGGVGEAGSGDPTLPSTAPSTPPPAGKQHSNGGTPGGRQARGSEAGQAANQAQAQAGGAGVVEGRAGRGRSSGSRSFKLGDFQLKQLRNGDVYKGCYSGSRKEGDGVYQFVNGDVFEGEFRHDRMDGAGVYTFSHEGRYEGHWRGAVYAGAGSETFAKGSTYHGQYSGGLRNGWGVCRFYNGDYYEGQWQQGLRDGRGMQQCTDDSNYVGDYVRGKRHGHGVYAFPNGDSYAGQYLDDLPHGHGVYSFAAGQRYEGQWHAGRKHGWAVYTVSPGSEWVALWSASKPQWVQPLAAARQAAAEAAATDPAAPTSPNLTAAATSAAGGEAGQGGEGEVASSTQATPDALRVEGGGAGQAGLGGLEQQAAAGEALGGPAGAFRAALEAQQEAAKASDVAGQRAREHWDAVGPVQPALRSAVAAAERAAAAAQAARTRARELALRLDLAVALMREGQFNAKQQQAQGREAVPGTGTRTALQQLAA